MEEYIEWRRFWSLSVPAKCRGFEAKIAPLDFTVHGRLGNRKFGVTFTDAFRDEEDDLVIKAKAVIIKELTG